MPVLCWLWLLISPVSATHPFYVSVTEMNYDAADSVLEVSVKLFTDDLAQALEARYQSNLHLGEPEEHPDADVFVALYLREQLSIQAHDLPLEQQYLGKEFEEDVTWCYLAVPIAQAPQALLIRNALLTDQFEAQRNLVHLRVGSQRKSLMLHRGKLSERVEF